MIDILAEFEKVAESLTREGRTFGKQAGMIEGMKPSDAPLRSRGLAYSAASYQVAAKAIRDKIKALRKQNA